MAKELEVVSPDKKALKSLKKKEKKTSKVQKKDINTTDLGTENNLNTAKSYLIN